MIPGKDYTPGFETEEKVNQCEYDSQRWFPHANHDLAFLTLCLAGEVGELANKVKKIIRGSAILVKGNQTHKDIVEEINDIRVYLYNLMGLSIFDDVNWETEWNKKRAFNEERFGPKGSTGPSTSETDGTQDRELPPRAVANLSLPKQVHLLQRAPVGHHTDSKTYGRPIRDNPQA